ncbi:MAG: four helix bundle protein [Thermodesulfobacteriota bacterium]|nr:four helix bundle protein [Thermodesulfobacteriota bacterium]
MRSAKVEKFEDLIAWQKAHLLATNIYKLTSKEPFSRDFGLNDQIQRAGVSVMSNIAEGFERYSRPEFRQFLSIARGSVGEVRSQLHIARSLNYISEQEFSNVYSICRDVGNLIGGLRKSLGKGGAS